MVVRSREGSRFVCPECGKRMSLDDHRDRRWRHLDIYQMKVADLFERHLDNLLTFCRHRLTAAALEAINAKIVLVKKHSRGIANVEHIKTLIPFTCGGLDLNPSPIHS